MSQEQHGAHAPRDKKSQLSLPVAIVFGSLVIAGAILLTKGGAPAAANVPQQGGAPAKISVRPVSPVDHILGSPNAKVVIVEYSDFECPFCSLIYPSLKRIVSESNGQVAWVYRNYPLDQIHPEARPAAEAAECIASQLGNDAYWKFADTVFANQKNMSADFYAKTAQSLGADMTAFNKCVSSKQFDSRINDDQNEAIQNGGQGTPFSIVIGKKGTPVPFSGALPYAQINSIVQSVESKQ